MEQNKEKGIEVITTYDGDTFNKEKTITVQFRNFNPCDLRIRTLLGEFIKKSEELGFRVGEPCSLDTHSTQEYWSKGHWDILLETY